MGSNTYSSNTSPIPDVAILDKSVIRFPCRRLRRKKSQGVRSN